ncbi:putative cell wall binding repeat 2-containing protein [Catenulispora acidiphila DSM 44928]|uniref:Putative cell wall binding repeat 2-containing protein n=1 Tax=Catenulispora acidiphila (strain DSM 44928 / JCM 14897 / NBRC 102108 / NRRL B-24433 / ID139908) TaxID=479433 RepID=C7PXA3_CATAD|nr:cell wall-binding repeat-containing protein [Catenulispora acidiphila]ACU69454.1 putative cell wall binding repeat 2-containing protein [Catenulispora acidiphila DSM 44928]
MTRIRLAAPLILSSAALISALMPPLTASAAGTASTPCAPAPVTGTPTGPLTAAVQSDDFPSLSGGLPPTHGPNQPGVFHLSGSGGVSPIVCFQYSVPETGVSNATISADASGRANLTLALPYAGLASVTVSAVDAAGNVSAPVTYSFNVLSAVPTKLSAQIEIGGSSDGTVTGVVTASGPNPVLNYHVDFGDGTTVNQASPAFRHVYRSTWWYQIVVTVTDSSGATTTATALNVRTTVPSTMQRVSGTTRYDTSTAVSRRLWADAADDQTDRLAAHTVVLASGATFPDALAGIPLASYKQGPLLLTEPQQLTDTTRQEIHRVLPKGGTVYVLGGQNAVSPDVAATLSGDGYHVIRYGGKTRYETALIIAKQGLDNPAHVVIATGTDYPDALAAGPAATGRLSSGGKPAAILLSDGATFNDAATAAYIRSKLVRYQTGMPNVTAIGWSSTLAGLAMIGVPDYIIDSTIKPGTPAKSGGDSWGTDIGTLYFIAGADRYTTAEGVAIEDTGPDCCAPDDPFVGYASGNGFADALTGGAALATLHGRLFLTAPNYVPTATTAIFPGPPDQVKGTTYTGTVFGGTQAVSQGVEDRLAQVLEAKEQ